jgi:hypothetical protein
MQTQDKTMRVINHKTMRRIVGVIAFALPWAVWLLAKEPSRLSSISAAYWTDSRDIFVGCLFAVGFFLAAYNGTGSCGILERLISRVACGCAISIAIFPNETVGAPRWILDICDLFFFGLEPNKIHNTAAISLFTCLSLLLLFFSSRASKKGKPHRSMVYLALSLGMIVGLPLLFYILKIKLGWQDGLFYVEFAGLLLFGVGWFIAGTYKEKVLNVPIAAKEYEPVEVDPGEFYVPTGIVIDEDAKYYFKAKGCWKDWIIRCGPSGWGPKWGYFTKKNRIKRQPVFMLCGNVGKSEDEDLNFCIGDKNTWSVKDEVKEKFKELVDRELYLFANDWKSKYSNNKELGAMEGGPLKVSIYRHKLDED